MGLLDLSFLRLRKRIFAGYFLIGFLTLFAAFLFTLPIIGYATWRGYKETIISDEWPQDPDTIT